MKSQHQRSDAEALVTALAPYLLLVALVIMALHVLPQLLDGETLRCLLGAGELWSCLGEVGTR